VLFRAPLALASLSVVLVPVVAAVATYLDAAVRVTLLALWIPAVAAGLFARGLARTRGRRWPPSDPDEPVLTGVHGAGQRLEVGDVEGGTLELQALRRRASPQVAPYVDLWIRYAREEAQRRDGVRISSRPTQEAMAAELGRLQARQGRPPLAVVALVIALGMAISVMVPIARGALDADGFACRNVQPILAAAEASPRMTPIDDPTLSHLVLVDPGEAATLVDDGGMGIERAAESRHDPAAADKLHAAGFVGAYRRDWETPAGRHLSAEIFAFGTPDGAARFHRQMSEYACRFSSLAFVGSAGETGLRVNYTGGDPIVEQLGWVDGSFRIVVTRSYAQAPPDHDEIGGLARLAAEHLASPH
jgi:hypothetical protein